MEIGRVLQLGSKLEIPMVTMLEKRMELAWLVDLLADWKVLEWVDSLEEVHTSLMQMDHYSRCILFLESNRIHATLD
jgi:hypothetical protein